MLNNRRYFYHYRDIVITVIFLDIYIDVLIIVNCYICWLTLSATAFITHTYINPKLKLLSTVLAGASSLIIMLPSEKPLHTILINSLKILSLSAIILTSFYEVNTKKKFVAALAYIGINILLAGGVYLTRGFFGENVIYTNNGVVYFDVSLTQLIVLTAFIYFALIMSSRLYSRYSDKNHSYKVEFTLCEKSYVLCAIADTGNLAKDIFTGKPVIICTGISLYVDDTVYPIPIPYNTISGEGILYAYKPDSIYIIDEKAQKHQVNALVAFVEDNSNEQRAIFNPSIL